MAITTIAGFVTALTAVNVAGITRAFAYPPEALSTADLPAKWVEFPEVEEGPMTFGYYGGWPTLRANIVVAVEPVGQEQQSANWSATLAMVDAIATALRATSVNTLGKAKIEWSIVATTRPFAEITYWTAVATVEAYG